MAVMFAFDWRKSAALLRDFGGTRVDLTVRKTGLPFFDALRLYGAIDLWVGIREDLSITDLWDRWQIAARRRPELLHDRAEKAFRQVWKKKKPDAASYCARLLQALKVDTQFDEDWLTPATREMAGVDAALQAGIRDTAAARYATLQSGQTSESTCCVAKIPLSDTVLAFAGDKRTEGAGDIVFLPLFTGRIDFAKVVSPLRLKVGFPNVLCAEALALLSLKTSLFAEDYEDRLTGVVFKTSFLGQRSDNYSGLLAIESTPVGKIRSPEFLSHLHGYFRDLVGRAWNRRGRGYETTEFTADALAMASWLMRAAPKHLTSMITSQERLRRRKEQTIFTRAEFVQQTFEETFDQMSYEVWKGDYEAVRKFAEAVASGILYARMVGDDGKFVAEREKAWYNEVALLRSAPSPKSFIERSMILIEQGHRRNPNVGLCKEFDPVALLSSVGDGGASFETFRDLFRMYLIQASCCLENTATRRRTDTAENSAPSQIRKEEQ